MKEGDPVLQRTVHSVGVGFLVVFLFLAARAVAGDEDNSSVLRVPVLPGSSEAPRLGSASAEELVPEDVYWDARFYPRDLDDEVDTMVSDGTGNIYIGGQFVAPGFASDWSYLVMWDTRSRNWYPLGEPPNGPVTALALGDNDLVAAGQFTSIGGITADHIARWDGARWHALGSGIGSATSVDTIVVRGTDVYVGGRFADAGGADGPVARWDGSSWSSLGAGFADPARVYALAYLGDDLYAGGSFSQGTGSPADFIARWDGGAWQPVGTGVDGTVYALAAAGEDLYAGGSFFMAGGTSVSSIARWDGASWHPLGSGIDNFGSVYSLAADGTDLYVGGLFDGAGGVDSRNVAKWDGASWSSLEAGFINDYGGTVYSLAVSEGSLYAGGRIYATSAGSVRYIARWDGARWSRLGTSLESPLAVDVREDVAYIAAHESGLGGPGGAATIHGWNGTDLEPVTPPLNDRVFAIAAGENDLFVGGDFTAGEWVVASHVARWDGAAWHPLGAGTNGRVETLLDTGTDLYAGGEFTQAGGMAANHVARWDGSAWHPLGAGVDDSVTDLAMIDGNLYVGGYFLNAGGAPARYVARWDGAAWHPVGDWPHGSVVALAVSGDILYAAGLADPGTPDQRVARWNGSAWQSLGGEFDEEVLALAVMDGDLYAGGAFSTAGGAAARCVARWDGAAWSPLGSGIGEPETTGDYVGNIGVIGRALLFRGSFCTAGGNTSCSLAQWMPRVNVSAVSLDAEPGPITVGDDPHGFYRPALTFGEGTTLDYPGGLPVEATLNEAEEIHVNGVRVNGAFTVAPDGLRFGGSGAALRIEFSEDDAAAFGVPAIAFRAARLVYPSNYPEEKEAFVEILSSSLPVPIRTQNGRIIYALTVPVSEIGSTYGAVPSTSSGVPSHLWAY